MSGALAGPGVVVGLLLLGLGTLAMKAAGPVLVGGGRRVPPWLVAAGGVLPTALLSALVATQVLGPGPEAARLAGVAVAGAAVALRAPFVVVVLAATATTAGLRSLGV